MRPFEYKSPSTVPELLALLEEYGDRCELLAGGTDLIPELNDRRRNPEMVININTIPELDYIKARGDTVSIGALATHAEIAAHPDLKRLVPILTDACASVGSPQIRNLGTIGGNLVNAAVPADGLCALLTLNASVKLLSLRGERIMTVEDFLQGEGKRRANVLAADEVLTEVTFPVPDAFTASAFVKHGKRKSLAISDIGAGVVLRFDESGMCTFASLRAGALARYPLRLNAAEDYLVGKHLDEVDIEALRSIFAAHEREATKNRAHKKYSMPGVFCHAVEAVMDRWNAMQEEHHD